MEVASFKSLETGTMTLNDSIPLVTEPGFKVKETKTHPLMREMSMNFGAMVRTVHLVVSCS